MIHKILNIEDKLLFIRTLYRLFYFKCFLTILPFSRFKNLYESLNPSKKTTDIEEKLIVKYIMAIASNLPFGFSCLPQALTLKYFLKNDSETEIILGVNTDQKAFKAHAWVERNGTYLIGDIPFEHYTPLWNWK
ncbi:lasso peptide biosynthesis B2 protein [Lacihabitans sp. LS3-19]|uniref:lasso peptide biosynthesis B2 protein n=1 Tax=Lacihabitans sp. LS3-19 TaxID=2487335 RepID=UPI0020CF6D31|nr:lasso peptide biosynthesis B2 protein [Lacihabitans sp. LS3-19]MCP9770350.1 lasso peptide biosynthesis B2 protein [Lacihabitans sp. LS3-19]